MAAGDTIPSTIRYRVARGDGSVETELKQRNAREFDQSEAEKQLYVNLGVPLIARHYMPPVRGGRFARGLTGLRILAGETLRIEAKSNADNGESIDVSADEFEIAGVRINTNYPKGHPMREEPTTLTVADNEVAADPAESDTSHVPFFEYTESHPYIFMVGGPQKVAPVEAA